MMKHPVRWLLFSLQNTNIRLLLSFLLFSLTLSVTQLYPTLTASFTDIAAGYVSAIEASISGVAAGNVKVDGAIAQHANKIYAVAAAAVAVVAGGAFAL